MLNNTDTSNMSYHVINIPQDKTYQNLYDELDKSYCQNSEFIELNKYGMAKVGKLSDDDYDVFWKCMQIFDAYGINYFRLYLNLLIGAYGDFSKGIEQWIDDEIKSYQQDADKKWLIISLCEMTNRFKAA